MNVFVDGSKIALQQDNPQLFFENWAALMRQIFDSGRLVSKYVIDEHDFYGDAETYITERFHSIEQVRIVTVSREEYLDDILSELKRYTGKLLAATEALAQAFYGEPKPEDWQQQAQLSEGLDWLFQSLGISMELMRSTGHRETMYAGFESLQTRLREHIRALEEGLLQQDYVRVGDLLQYELAEIFSSLQQQLPPGVVQ